MAKKESATVKDRFEAVGANAIGEAPAPGTQTYGFEIENLGFLDEFPTKDTPITKEGAGPYCIVVASFLTGAEQTFVRGDVRKLSFFVSGYGTEENVDVLKKRIRRLFDIGAIRKASRDESRVAHVELPVGIESKEVTSEKIRRINLEEENAILREKLGLAADAVVRYTPELAEASGAAHAAGAESDETKTDNSDDADDDGFDL